MRIKVVDGPTTLGGLLVQELALKMDEEIMAAIEAEPEPCIVVPTPEEIAMLEKEAA